MQGLADFADSLLGGAILLGLSLALGGAVFGVVVLAPWRRPVPPAHSLTVRSRPDKMPKVSA